MWRVWVGLLLLATPVWAEENATAYEALRVVGSDHAKWLFGGEGPHLPRCANERRELEPEHVLQRRADRGLVVGGAGPALNSRFPLFA